MDKLLTFEQISQLSNNAIKAGQKIVLVGGCFDLLHTGHIHFLQKAKETGDILVVLLESDSAIRRKKGPHRPINTQADRAFVLSHLLLVDYIYLLPEKTTEKDYHNVTQNLKPAIIATTSGDPYIEQKKQAAQGTNASVVEVLAPINDKSTSHIAKLLAQENL